VADDTHVVLADPGGKRLCVIEPGNNYLAGTGHLGEVTCDGTRPSACSGAMCSVGRWCGRERADRSPVAARRYQDLMGRLGGRRTNPRREGIGSASTWSVPTPPARRNDLSPAERSVFPTCLTESTFLTPTATNSACTESER
jgi:hypothetical protein